MTGKKEIITTTNWLEKQQNALHKLDELAFELTGYSNSFHITGNVTMANNLAGIANEVSNASKDIHEAIGENISEEIKRSGESSKAVFEAALAGILLERKEV